MGSRYSFIFYAAFGDAGFSMSVVAHAFLFPVPPQTFRPALVGERTGPKTDMPMTGSHKSVFIGEIIRRKVDESPLSYAEFARRIHLSRSSLYDLFASKDISVERLLLISRVLRYDFLSNVYLRERPLDESRPFVAFPLRRGGIDLSDVPEHILGRLRASLEGESVDDSE